MKNQIGIVILDLYSEADLNNCYNSIPKDIENVLVCSDTKNSILENVETKKFNDVQIATLKNYALSQFRIKELKHFFILYSNQIVKDSDFFEKTIKLAETFGTWCMVGPEKEVLSVEDEQTNLSLSISNQLNTDFMYLFNGIVSNVGYFDERYFNTKNLDVLDYIIKMRNKKIYPPNNFHPIVNGIESSNSNISKTGYKDLSNADQSVHMSYAYFLTVHGYIPSQNDPEPVSNEELLKSLEEIQKNYSKK